MLRLLQVLPNGLAQCGNTLNNLFLRQLEENQQLRSFADSCKYDWSDEYNLVRNLYQQVENAPFFQTYMEQTEQSYEADRDVCRQIYRTFICNNDQLDELFEGRSLYWNDDKAIVDTFVLKTINRFTAGSTADQPLLPQFRTSTKNRSPPMFSTELIIRKYSALLLSPSARMVAARKL